VSKFSINDQKFTFYQRKALGVIHHGSALNRIERKIKVTVTLTSYGQRICTVDTTIKSLLSQRLKPDRVVLWLYQGDLDREPLPAQLSALVHMGLTIRYVEKDTKSYKKLVPALSEYPNDILITCDDDVVYPYDFIEGLYSTHLLHPECVVAYRCLWMALKRSQFAPYMSWRSRLHHTPSAWLFPTGAGGILYPPHCLHSDVSDEQTFTALTPTADDVWFKCMALLQGTKTIQVAGRCVEFPVVPNTQDIALWKTNASHVRCDNDAMIENVNQRYNIVNILRLSN